MVNMVVVVCWCGDALLLQHLCAGIIEENMTSSLYHKIVKENVRSSFPMLKLKVNWIMQ